MNEMTSSEAAAAACRAIPDALPADGELPYAVFVGPFVLSWWPDDERRAVHSMITHRHRRSGSMRPSYGTTPADLAVAKLTELHRRLTAAERVNLHLAPGLQAGQERG